MTFPEAAATLDAMAAVYEAGAKRQRGYMMNIERQQQAEALEAMAKEARKQAGLLRSH